MKKSLELPEFNSAEMASEVFFFLILHYQISVFLELLHVYREVESDFDWCYAGM